MSHVEKKNVSRPNIILTGFMATGKSTVGRILARRLGYRFVDTDHLIEKRSGLSVEDIFRIRGEAQFRKLETKVARELGDQWGLVIATGGGLVLDPSNVETLERHGRIFCLTATPEAIMERACGEAGGRRPLLQAGHPAERILSLLAERAPVYEGFPQLDTTGKRPEDVVAALLAMLR